MSKFLDLAGRTFGRLTVMELSKKVKTGKRFRYYWKCKCECGNITEVRTDSLTSGRVKSCGCLKQEQDKINLTAFHRHKLSNTLIWHRYYNMINRCYNPDYKRYSDYGGRGIKVCNEWKNSFDEFVKWAYETGFSEELQLDRIDNNGNYEPLNCRWVTLKENCRNRRSNVLIEYEGELITLVELSEKLDLPYKVVYYKFRKQGFKRSDI